MTEVQSTSSPTPDKLLEAPVKSKGRSWGQWPFLALLTVSLSSFIPLAFFVPVPLGMANLLYGRTKGLLFGLLCLSLVTLVTVSTHLSYSIPGLFIISMVNAWIVSEMIFRRINPVKGIVQTGLVFILLVSLVALAFYSMKGGSYQVELQNTLIASVEKMSKENAALFTADSEQGQFLKEFLAKPQEFIKEFLQIVPVIVFAVLFFELWACFFMILRNSLIWRQKIIYPFAIRHLLYFRLPDFFIWILMAALGLALLGNYWQPGAEVVGYDILYGLSFFYFLQGLGVYLDLLNFFKIVGIFRPLLILLTVFWAWRFLVLVGVLDVWLNFRKFMKNKNQGDLV
ncbi:MAG: DUF2232 domain-containing protein [Pseudomonadota bacterium]